MRQARTKWAILLAVLLVAAFGALALANGIQHDHSRIKITEDVIDTWRQDERLGSLPYKLYTPLTATAEHKAPGVLLVASPWRPGSSRAAPPFSEPHRKGTIAP